MSLSEQVAQNLEISRKELLDLTFRNPLLNFRYLKARGVEVIDTTAADSFNALISGGKKLPFRPATQRAGKQNQKEEEEAIEAEEESYSGALFLEFDALPDEPLQDSVRKNAPLSSFKTAASSAELHKRLLNTLYTARSFIEEQGVNTLFLALGMLSWYEADSSEVCRRSPLILIPVKLERASASELFYLQYTGDDVVINDSLKALLETDFGITIPDIGENNEINVSAYIEEVRKSIIGKSRWVLDENVIHLAFFSYSKFRMYKDLEEKSWPDEAKPSAHPIITSLLASGFKDIEPRLTEKDHLDEKLSDKDVRTVIDADSSQILAIEAVKQGCNLVIQGPPGTGKSQTITNIIAEALGQGKTVLFVSEKMAALEVVKRRLDALGLGDACLELHSNKTDKKIVLKELKRTLELGQPVLGTVDEDAAELNEARVRLNSYARLAGASVGNSALSLYNIHGEWIQLNRELAERPSSEQETARIPRLNIPEFVTWTLGEARQRERFVSELQAHIAVMGLPSQHPYWGSQKTVLLPSDKTLFQETFTSALNRARELRAKAEHLAVGLQMPSPTLPRAALALAQAVQRANATPPFVGVQLGMNEWLTRRADLEALVKLGVRLRALRDEYGSTFTPEAWSAEPMLLREIRQMVAAHGQKWYRFLVGEWRTSQKKLALLMTDSRSPKEAERQLTLLDALLEYRQTQAEFRERETLGQALFAAQWQGERSEWNVLEQLLSWIIEVHQEIGDQTLPKAFLDFLVASPDLKPLEPAAQALREAHVIAQEAVRACTSLLEIRAGDILGEEQGNAPLEERSFSTQEALLLNWASNTERLQEMVVLNHLTIECRKVGLSALIDTANTWADSAINLLPMYRVSYLEALLGFMYQAHPELTTFSGTTHATVLKQFQDLDVRTLRHNRVLLAERHWQNLPTMQGEGGAGKLRHEFESKSPRLKIRKIMSESGRVIQAIKPVFMMSPLSVATYLPSGLVSFDLVVFDEASQVKPVDALGALLRAKQATVVGDSNQLPPTSFFDKLNAIEDTTQEGETADMESILGLFVAQGAKERTLKWHYRSRHESLIAVSNQEIYKNRLIIFPSPDTLRERYGLVYHYLPKTVYDRGGSRTNRLEAKAVAEAVIDHARLQLTKPLNQRLTLGVAAFSMPQMQAILDQLEVLRRSNPDCEPFFNTGGQEPFFVKNLENVQGDERDVIYISVGYGFDSAGKPTVNFGPINYKNGERRLNVLITRARLRCEVFTNLTADDIDSERTKALGVNVLKQFLHYAQTGFLSASLPSGREPDSPFEREVLTVLRSLVYDVTPQVGCAGYFIDIAVKDPKHPGRYILGIECDGATYHSARSARDRDRLREGVLNSMGWKLHRIWSTDWVHRYSQEVQRLHEAVKVALEEAAREREAFDFQQSPDETIPTTAPPSVEPLEEAVAIARTSTERPILTVPLYEKIEIPRVYARDIYAQPISFIAQLVVAVVEKESPVSIALVARRIAEAFDLSSVTEKYLRFIRAGAAEAERLQKIRISGDFFWSKTMEEPSLRNRANLDNRERQVETIAPEEIAAAVCRVVAEAYGMPFGDIAKATSRVFGIKSMTDNTKRHIESVVSQLIERNVLNRLNEQVTLTER